MGDLVEFPAELVEAGIRRRTIANLRALLNDGASQRELRALVDAHFEQVALHRQLTSRNSATLSERELS